MYITISLRNVIREKIEKLKEKLKIIIIGMFLILLITIVQNFVVCFYLELFVFCFRGKYLERSADCPVSLVSSTWVLMSGEEVERTWCFDAEYHKEKCWTFVSNCVARRSSAPRMDSV